MPAPRKPTTARLSAAPAERHSVDLEALSRETGVPVEVLRTFAGISDPANEHLFTTESARRAFAGVTVRDVRT